MTWVATAGLRKAAAGLGLFAALSACTTTTTVGTGVPSATVPSRSDRTTPTAVDENSDAAKRAQVRLELASAYFGRGQLNTALDEVRLALAANPQLGGAYNLRGLIYASLGDDAQAEESFKRALQIDPRDADTMQNYGWYLCQHQRYAEADSMFRQAQTVPQYRGVPRTLLTQGICQARTGELTQAEATLVRAFELDPGNPVTAVNLAEVLFRRAEYERARFYIRRVNSNQEWSSAQTLWLAARVEHRLGNQQGAQDLGTQLRNRFPQTREAVAFEQGKFDE